jgi:glycosyltransferase involved in cell wall biosynthesis
MKRLCIVNPYEHGGGAEYQISLLIDTLVDSGEYDVHYLTHFVDARDRPRRYRVSRIGNGGSIPRFGYFMEAKSLYGLLVESRPDIIYQRVACAYTGVCAFYSRRHAVPLVWHAAHDTEVTRQHLDNARNFVRLRLEKWAVEWGVRNASRIVVQTQRQAELLRENYARTADAVIPNFHPSAIEPIDKAGPLTVVWIANLKPWKQPEIFVRLAQALKSCESVRFIMVGAPAAGAGNLQWQEALMQEIESTPSIQYVGEITQRQVNELLAHAHIFVNTSVHEGFPNTFIQAWLRDVAVVSLQVDPDHVLSREGAGIVAHSESGLRDAVRGLIEDEGARAEYVRRGREHANTHHSMRNAQRMVAFLRECTVGSRDRSSWQGA